MVLAKVPPKPQLQQLLLKLSSDPSRRLKEEMKIIQSAGNPHSFECSDHAVFNGTSFHSRERNRIHARISRLRKKMYIQAMKQEVEHLTKEHHHLRGLFQQHFGSSYDEFRKERESDPEAEALRAERERLASELAPSSRRVRKRWRLEPEERVERRYDLFLALRRLVVHIPHITAASATVCMHGSHAKGKSCSSMILRNRWPIYHAIIKKCVG